MAIPYPTSRIGIEVMQRLDDTHRVGFVGLLGIAWNRKLDISAQGAALG